MRDIILGVNKEPHDIDMTMALEPDTVFSCLQKASSDEFSLFRTEKFGTVTLIRKEDNTTYEITPFREEGGYSDNRHPDEIRRSNSLVADAKRRDFTINCLYYTIVDLGGKKTKAKKSDTVSHEDIIPAVSEHGRYYNTEQALIVLQHHELIEKFFTSGVFQKDAFSDRAAEHHVLMS